MGFNPATCFDISRPGQSSGYAISALTHDINPKLSSANKKIEWRVEGSAPTGQ